MKISTRWKFKIILNGNLAKNWVKRNIIWFSKQFCVYFIWRRCRNFVDPNRSKFLTLRGQTQPDPFLDAEGPDMIQKIGFITLTEKGAASSLTQIDPNVLSWGFNPTWPVFGRRGPILTQQLGSLPGGGVATSLTKIDLNFWHWGPNLTHKLGSLLYLEEVQQPRWSKLT